MKEKIMHLFLYNKSLKFSDMEKKLGIRSNKLAYHIKSLLKKNILVQRGDNYCLSETSEYLLPYLSDKKSALPVILIKIGNKEECFLYKRLKRPFLGKLSLPGGRLMLGESIPNATKRIMSKYNIQAKFKQVNLVALEHVRNKNKIIHSFLLIFVTARTKDKVHLFDIKHNKNKIIPSDYKLITYKGNPVEIPIFLTSSNI